MLYLIGGSQRGGKTTLSKKLSKVLDVPYISTDYLRLVVMPYFKGKDKDANFPFGKMFDAVGIDKIFTDYSGQELLEADIVEAKAICPGIASFIKHLSHYKTNYIIEGMDLLPSFVNHFKNDKNFKIVILTKIDVDKIFNGLLRSKNSDDWIADYVKDDNILYSAAKSLSEYGKYFTEESKKYGLMCINTEDNFPDKIEDAINYLKN